MPVRKTERRLPAGLTPDELGQSVAAEGDRAVLISYIISPLVVNRQNRFVVFVTDASLMDAVQTFAWTITENTDTPGVQSTPTGEFVYTPQSVGHTTVEVKLLDAGNQALATLTLSQEIVMTNAELEDLIEESASEPGPGIGNLEVARELVNDHNPYYQAVALQTPEAGDGFKQFVFSMVSDGALQQPPAQRQTRLDQLAAALNDGTEDFVSLTSEGAGVCKIRMSLLAMITPGGLPWTELPEETGQRLTADEQLRQTLAALDENKKIDLFNLIRFPKSNITYCGKIVEELRNRYFPGTNFTDVLMGLSGTRAHWISRYYREGPLQRTA
ncbi:hypothetical protein ACFPMF_22990 [Larkinella bovis]|uniref:Uncharacterized protein n=1 Tax=Larkinella bovis TaxID=683041 RepID=A0ABW0IFE8_9BACT